MQCIALDCEMVGVAPRYVPGRKPKKQSNMVARVVIVNDSGRVLYDSLVAPQELIIDYRTHISGVRPGDLDRGVVITSSVPCMPINTVTQLQVWLQFRRTFWLYSRTKF